jgi:L-amino acid N-acyltransferase YncA|uniref:arsinothricin resistance N-acetyltransferase ArsN1 family B n=1 Tax=Cephaloticoccus sp. TaxID=1985742 RepID=UPI00404B188A
MSDVIRPCQSSDAAAICAIYNHYIAETVITFEESPVEVADMAARIVEITAKLPWLVSVTDGLVTGYAYAGPWKGRCAYRYTVESTVYLAPTATGRGLGTQLYQALIDAVQTLGQHSVIGGVALPNPASVALHEKLGFRKVAHFEQVGWKFNRWIDVGYWERILSAKS